VRGVSILIAMNNFQSPFQLQGKTILVTGASSGLGQAIAVECARAGATLVLTGRNLPRLQAVHASLSGCMHRYIVADLTDASQRNALVDEVGSVNGIVHSAGVDGVAPLRMVSDKLLQQVMGTNFHVPILLNQRMLYRKQILDSGSIVFVASIAALTGKVGVGPYSASKSALLGAMRCLALEVAKHGIRVNALCPGIVDTPLFDNHRAWLTDVVAKTYPLGLGRPEDVAYAAIYFLCDASRKVTGTSFSLDGGIPYT
jgi:NAD(P)-dependent dehydrogenase (short-subunit alcohol dehydrogenase family)